MPALSFYLPDDIYDKVKNLPNRSELITQLLNEHFFKLKKTRESIEDLEKQKKEIESRERELYEDMENENEIIKKEIIMTEEKRNRDINSVRKLSEEVFAYPLTDEEIITYLDMPKEKFSNNVKTLPEYLDILKDNKIKNG